MTDFAMISFNDNGDDISISFSALDDTVIQEAYRSIEQGANHYAVTVMCGQEIMVYALKDCAGLYARVNYLEVARRESGYVGNESIEGVFVDSAYLKEVSFSDRIAEEVRQVIVNNIPDAGNRPCLNKPISYEAPDCEVEIDETAALIERLRLEEQQASQDHLLAQVMNEIDEPPQETIFDGEIVPLYIPGNRFNENQHAQFKRVYQAVQAMPNQVNNDGQSVHQLTAFTKNHIQLVGNVVDAFRPILEENHIQILPLEETIQQIRNYPHFVNDGQRDGVNAALNTIQANQIDNETGVNMHDFLPKAHAVFQLHALQRGQDMVNDVDTAYQVDLIDRLNEQSALCVGGAGNRTFVALLCGLSKLLVNLGYI